MAIKKINLKVKSERLWLPEYEWLQEALSDYKRGLLNEYQFGLIIVQRMENRR